MNPLNLIATKIYETLSGGTALTALLSGTTAIYRLEAPEEAELPYVVFSFQGGGHQTPTSKDFWDGLMFVRGYSSASAGAAGSIDAQISSLLHRKSLDVGGGWTNFWMTREEDLELKDPDTARDIWMAGGFYRIRLST